MITLLCFLSGCLTVGIVGSISVIVRGGNYRAKLEHELAVARLSMPEADAPKRLSRSGY